MRNGLLLLAGACLVAGCSFDMPNFLGREGGGDGSYQLGGGDPPPVPRPVPMREATVERALHGVIVRVEGEAPTQGYYSAALRPLGDGAPDAAGVVSFEFVAVPPATVAAVGPARTRQLSAAVFVPNLALKQMRAVRLSGGGAVQTLGLPAAPAPPQPTVSP